MQVVIWLALVVMFVVEMASRFSRSISSGQGGHQANPQRRARQVPHGAPPWERPGGQRWYPLDRPAAPEWSDPYAPATARARASGTTGAADTSDWDSSEQDEEAGEYLGSLGFTSEEGASMHDTGAVLSSLSMMFDDEIEDAGEAHVSGPIAAALASLRSTGGPSEGAGAAIVLAEILGPPRALRRAGPGASRARWK